MTAPNSIINPATGLPVWTGDPVGNTVQTGTATATGLVLKLSATAATPAPGTLLLYSPDGQALSTVNEAGVTSALPVTTGGNLAVTGNATIGGTLAVTGTSQMSNQLVIGGSNANGLLYISNAVATTGNPGDLTIASTSATDNSIGTFVVGDADPRFVVHSNGQLTWGSGAAGTDTALARTGAGTMAFTGIVAMNTGTSSAGSAPAITPTFANGTASQLTDLTRDYMVYLQIGTAGTAFTLAIGPTSGVATTLMASATPLADSLLTVRLPAGWFLKWAGTSSTLTTQTAVGC